MEEGLEGGAPASAATTGESESVPVSLKEFKRRTDMVLREFFLEGTRHSSDDGGGASLLPARTPSS